VCLVFWRLVGSLVGEGGFSVGGVDFAWGELIYVGGF